MGRTLRPKTTFQLSWCLYILRSILYVTKDMKAWIYEESIYRIRRTQRKGCKLKTSHKEQSAHSFFHSDPLRSPVPLLSFSIMCFSFSIAPS
jgi:hypothetical protein